MGYTVIAIKDSPIISSHYGQQLQAYRVGDKFEVIKIFDEDHIIVWHTKFGYEMVVCVNCFETLDFHRGKMIDKVLDESNS